MAEHSIWVDTKINGKAQTIEARVRGDNRAQAMLALKHEVASAKMFMERLHWPVTIRIRGGEEE